MEYEADLRERIENLTETIDNLEREKTFTTDVVSKNAVRNELVAVRNELAAVRQELAAFTNRQENPLQQGKRCIIFSRKDNVISREG